MSEPLITLRTTWLERKLIKLFGRKVYVDGRFAGWIYKGRWFI